MITNYVDPQAEFFDAYQEAATSTAIFPKEVAFSYLPMKLTGEAGEINEKIGKVWRKQGLNTPQWIMEDSEFREELAKELGDVLWYIAVLADTIGYTLSDIARINRDKLFDRKERGVLHGNGDNR